MNVQQLMNVAAERQDWNEEVQLIHALGFIDSLVVAGTIGSADLADYLDAVEREESAEVSANVRNEAGGSGFDWALNRRAAWLKWQDNKLIARNPNAHAWSRANAAEFLAHNAPAYVNVAALRAFVAEQRAEVTRQSGARSE